MKPAILFDMDGVIVDSEPVINAAAITGLAEYGVNADPEDFLPFVGTGEDSYIGGVAEKYGLKYITEMKDRVYQIYLDIVPERIKIFAGIHELLTNLASSGHKIALASSADRVKIDANLKAASIDPSLFNVIISGEDVVRKKPAPDIYLTAAKLLGTEPSECIVVEDAINGIIAAKEAGMKCIALATSFDRRQLMAVKPNLICNTLSEIYSSIEKLK